MLGNDQSPASGQAATASAPGTARQGRSSSTTSFSASLTAYATTVPAPVRTIPAARRASLWRTAVQPSRSGTEPRATRVSSVTGSRR
ncbi:hypothetical protein [Streptomyces sp. NPDC048438]|uniref:hypothetical protein n=1 Tax=Streptomyces sp. NPDC048438 TaxID=3365551 RepID=UPI00371F4A1E